MLTEFTTFDEIRAVLGVSDEELEDATLLLPLYEKALKLDLETVGAGLVAQFRTVSAVAYGSRTADQQTFFDLVRLFSAYAVAMPLLTSLPYFAEFRIQDGWAQKERIADPFDKTREGVIAGFTAFRLKLSAAYTAIVGGTAVSRVTRTLAVGTGLTLDPVTNT